MTTALGLGLVQGQAATAHPGPEAHPPGPNVLAQTSQSSTQSASQSISEVTLGQVVGAALPGSSQFGETRVASGTYLFGEAEQAGQIGHEYMVMQVMGDRVVGGFYQPRSEFSCFNGTINSQELSLWVEDPHRPGGNNYSVPIYLNNQFATSEFVLPYENALGLQGTHRVKQLDAESRRVLAFCRTSQDLSYRFEATYGFVSPGSIMPTEWLTR